MEFKPFKCRVVQNPSPGAVYAAWTGAGSCQQRQVFGMDIFSNFSWNTHVDRITANTIRSLGFIKRKIKTKSPLISEIAYQSLVRPQLEYTSAVRDPHSKDKTYKVEIVQRRAAP